MNACNICGAPFDTHLHQDCGGDCLLCMATVAGDTDCALRIVPLLAADRAKAHNNLRTAVNALRSYQYGNTSEELAASIANALDAYLDRAAP